MAAADALRYAIKATGTDGYTEVISVAPGNRQYTHLYLYCETKDAIISLDGGLSDHIYLRAGTHFPWPDISFTTVHAKNAATGQNFANLTVHAW